MLTVGEKFPSFELTATVDLDVHKAFETITEESFPGKWKVYSNLCAPSEAWHT